MAIHRIAVSAQSRWAAKRAGRQHGLHHHDFRVADPRERSGWVRTMGKCHRVTRRRRNWTQVDGSIRNVRRIEREPRGGIGADANVAAVTFMDTGQA
jgi:hypothetical protein